jgi:hypothetical protein
MGDISVIADNIIDIVNFCLVNKTVWKENKPKLLDMLEGHNPHFYNSHNRVCHNIVEMDNIEPLIEMLKTIYKVQSGILEKTKADKIIADAINGTFCDPILNSDKLRKEREEKLKNM